MTKMNTQQLLFICGIGIIIVFGFFVLFLIQISLKLLSPIRLLFRLFMPITDFLKFGVWYLVWFIVFNNLNVLVNWIMTTNETQNIKDSTYEV